MIEISTLINRNIDSIIQRHWNNIEIILRNKIRKSKISRPTKIFLTKELKTIITASPDVLIKVDRRFKRFVGKEYYESHVRGQIKKIFNYNQFVSKRKNQTYSLAYDLANNLNINTCPYCNRNYIVTVVRKSRNSTNLIVRPDFDHFFPQHKFPLLALSFYNLIPCCSLCNRSLKGSKVMSLKKNIHPYIEGFDNSVSFSFIPNDVDSMIGIGRNISIDFVINCLEDNGKSKRAINNITDFKLQEIYTKSHKDEVADIIRKFHISGGRYLQIIEKIFPQLGSLEELYKIAFANYYNTEDFEKRPLSKLTRDIFEQLKFILPV